MGRLSGGYAPLELLDVAAAAHAFWLWNDADRIAYVVERASSLAHPCCRLAPNAPLLADHLAIYRRYFQIYRGHQPKPYPGRSLFVMCSGMRGEGSDEVRSMLQGQTRHETIEGNHVACLRPPGPGLVARFMREELGLRLSH
ncbi:MAG: hypothetical protein WDO56_11930 [Gammaproteobacteria bacterium]